MLLDEVLNYWNFMIAERALLHHSGSAVCLDEELRRTLLSEFAVSTGMDVHCLQDAVRREVEPMPQNLLCKILWHS